MQGEPEQVARLLRDKGYTISCAESCTGGLLTSCLTDVPGSSAYMAGAVVTYTDACKERFAKVRKETLQRHGAVSRETACEMAEGIRETMGTDLGVSVTGVAGPDGDGSGKPLGLVYISVSGSQGTFVTENRFAGDRRHVKEQSVEKALLMLADYLGNC